jgi:hypothetical protein
MTASGAGEIGYSGPKALSGGDASWPERHSSISSHAQTAEPFKKWSNATLVLKTDSRDIVCSACDGPLPGREGELVLKYFLLRKAIPPRERAKRSRGVAKRRGGRWNSKTCSERISTTLASVEAGR